MLKKLTINRAIKTKWQVIFQGYLNDQRLRQAKKTQSEVRSIANDLASISIEKSKKALGAKRNKHQNRNEYNKTYMRKYRKNPALKAKERELKQSARRNPVFRAKEIVYQKVSKQSTRKDPAFKTKERESKQSARKDPVFKTKERESKQSARKNPVFRAKEIVY